MIELVMRLAIVFLSLITIPYLVSLIKSTTANEAENDSQKSTKILLTALFFVMLFGSIMSLTISTMALLPNAYFFNGHFTILSRARTLLLTIGNFFLAMHFYHIHNGK